MLEMPDSVASIFLAASVVDPVAGPAPVHYLPIATTLFSVFFLGSLVFRASRRGWPPHLNWWAIGVFFYGLGTALESAITLWGNSAELTRAWYIAGALLGGYPLATGSVYLLAKRRTAHILTGVSLAFVIAATIAVLLSPINTAALQPHKPGGDAIGWTWVRAMTPFINIYAAIFLIGGAVYSSVKFLLSKSNMERAIGTAFIAVGALLPGIGGTMAKAGLVEGLYVGEFVGLVLIWIGYEVCIRARRPRFEGGAGATDARHGPSDPAESLRGSSPEPATTCV